MADLDSLLKPTPLVADENVRTGLDLGLVPEEEGRLVDLSRRSGMPVEQLRGAPKQGLDDLVQRDQRLRVLQREQRVAQWMADNPGYSTISHDDTQSLERIARAGDAWKQAYEQAPTTWERVVSTTKQLMLTPAMVVAGAAKGFTDVGRFVLGIDNMLGFEETEADRSAARASKFYSDELAWMTEAGRQSYLQGSLRWAGFDRPFGLTEIATGAGSLIPSVMLGGAGRLAAAGTAFMQSAGATYGDLADQGENSPGKVLVSGLITGALTYIFPGTENALRSALLRSAAPKELMRTAFARSLGVSAAGEAFEEGVDQFLQAFVVQGKPVREAVADAVQAGLVGGVLGAMAGVVEARSAAQETKAQAAKQFYGETRKVFAEIDGSKTNERSKEVADSFLASAAPEFHQAKVFIAAEDAQEILKDQKAIDTLVAAGISEAKLKAARDGTADLDIPLSKLKNVEAGLRDMLLQHGRANPGQMSGKEAEKLLEELKAEKQQIKNKEKLVSNRSKASINAERKRIVTELQDSMEIMKRKAQDGRTIAEQVVDTFYRGAMGLYERNPTGAKNPIDLLKKITFQRGTPDKKTENALAQIRQAIVDAAGPEGKTALSGVSFSAQLGGAAARVDVLTGQVAVDPGIAQAVNAIDMVMQQVKAQSMPDLKGKTVKVGGKDVQAEEAVGSVRKKVEMLRRLRDCVGGA